MSLIQRKLGRAKALASSARRQAHRAIDILELYLRTRPRFDIDAESMVSVEVPRYSPRDSTVSSDRPTDTPRQSQPPPPEPNPILPRRLWLMNPDPTTPVKNERTHQWLENPHASFDLYVPSQGQKKRYVPYHPRRRVPLTGEGLTLDMSSLRTVHQAPIAELPGIDIMDLAAAELEAEPVQDIGHYPSSLVYREVHNVRTRDQHELFLNVGADAIDDVTEQMPVGLPSAEGGRDERQVLRFQLHRLTVHTAEWRRLSHEFPRGLTLLEDAP